MTSFDELRDAARLFLARHEAALASGEPARMAEACAGLLEGLDALVREARALHPPLAGLDVLAKRAAESEGALLHLRLTASNVAAHAGPPPLERASRLAREAHAARRALAGLRRVLDPPGPGEVEPRALVHAARECLLAGAPEAAALALACALPAGLAAPFGERGARDLDSALALWSRAGRTPPEPADACRATMERLRGGPLDALEGWRALDLVERVVERAAMSRA